MSNIDKLKNPDNYIIYKPRIVPVRALSGEVTVGQVANGSFHTILLSEGGSLYACGLSRYAGHQVIDPEEEEEQAQMNEQDKEKFNNQRLVEFID
jgi:alpha-tubulin suppressor-like RCC1 family protein